MALAEEWDDRGDEPRGLESNANLANKTITESMIVHMKNA